MNTFHSPSADELLKTLQVKFPSTQIRTKGRANEYTENWVMCHFLAAVSGTDLLDYPLCVEHVDKPDLVLTSRSGTTGIEITRAVPLNEQKVRAFSKDKGITDPRYIPIYSPGEKKRSRKEIENIARGRIPIKPIMGDSIEKNWIDAMMHIVKHKAAKFSSSEFMKHKNNWLLIYDDWSPAVPGYDDVAATLARWLFNSNWKSPFGKIFILESNHTVWEFSPKAEIMRHDVLDIFPK